MFLTHKRFCSVLRLFWYKASSLYACLLTRCTALWCMCIHLSHPLWLDATFSPLCSPTLIPPSAEEACYPVRCGDQEPRGVARAPATSQWGWREAAKVPPPRPVLPVQRPCDWWLRQRHKEAPPTAPTEGKALLPPSTFPTLPHLIPAFFFVRKRSVPIKFGFSHCCPFPPSMPAPLRFCVCGLPDVMSACACPTGCWFNCSHVTLLSDAGCVVSGLILVVDQVIQLFDNCLVVHLSFNLLYPFCSFSMSF